MHKQSASTEKPKQVFTESYRLRQRAHQLIPGGCHTYAKGDDQYPQLSPGFIARGEGCHVWDVDGNEFIEYGMGLRAVTLGHAYPPVVEAAVAAMKDGINFTRPAPLEVACAEKLLSIVDNGEMVKFAKDGSLVVTSAVKLARAFTGRDMVAICADHPFFSYNDWFIGTTTMDAGIPEVNKSLTLTFPYDDLAAIEALFEQHPDRIACIVMEAERFDPPSEGYLKKVSEIAHQHGALFVLDEMITGFRWHLKGAQHVYGVKPDMSAFGKALANGYSVSALVGRRDIMEAGGLTHDKERVFLLSTTHGAENHGLAAALKTMEIYETEGIAEALHEKGTRLSDGVNAVADELEMRDYVGALGRPCNLVYYTRDREGKPSQPYRSIFMQELIKNGVLGPSFVISYSHSNDDIDRTIEAFRQATLVYRQALENGWERFLVGPSIQPVYRKYNREEDMT